MPEEKQISVTFDEALSMGKFGKCNYILILVAGAIVSAVLFETIGTSFVIAVAGCDLQMTTLQKGVLSAVVFLGIIVSSHLWGFLADTQGRKKVIVSTLFLTFATTFVSSFANSFWTITVGRFFAGFFISGPSATIYAYLGEFHNHRNGSRAIMGAAFVSGIGCLFLPVIAWLIINQNWELPIPFLDIVYRPWRLFLVACGLLGLISGFALLWLPESPKFVYHHGNLEQTIRTIQWMHRMNSGRREPSLQINSIVVDEEDQQFEERLRQMSNAKGFRAFMKLIWDKTAPLFRVPYWTKTVLVCFLHFGAYLTSHGMFMFYPDIVNQLMEIHETGINRTTVCEAVYTRRYLAQSEFAELGCSQQLDLAAYEYTLILEVLFTVLFVLIWMLINVVQKLTILAVSFSCCGLAGLMIIFVDIPVVSIWLYTVMLLAAACGYVINAFIVELFPTNIRALAVCISLMFGRLGTVVGTNMLGLLLDSYCEFTFAINGMLLLVCAVLSFCISKSHNRKESEFKPNSKQNSSGD
ncbi:synaptic vesicle glycoprotein 2B-like [Topomyia yanbarensis]|uniref:synaptic vesicle glycoprotein 2B-like n=1 Tax=Topomyia yanbarensis TaxID=2498891 RepID=UPI00273C3750|nr:synaptic vesicle glycoprotein 2B-like [Topomyia yanbarensis]